MTVDQKTVRYFSYDENYSRCEIVVTSRDLYCLLFRAMNCDLRVEKFQWNWMAIKKEYFEEGIFLGVRDEARSNRFFGFMLNLRHVEYSLYKTFVYHDLSETYCKCIYDTKRNIVSTYLLFIFLTLSTLTKEFNQTLYLQLNFLANTACSRWIRSEIRYHRTRG